MIHHRSVIRPRGRAIVTFTLGAFLLASLTAVQGAEAQAVRGEKNETQPKKAAKGKKGRKPEKRGDQTTTKRVVKFTALQRDTLKVLEQGRKRLAKKRRAPTKLQRRTQADVDRAVKAVVKRDTKTALKHWKAVVNQVTVQPSSSAAHTEEVNGLVQEILRRSYLETNADLVAYADKVEQLNEQQKAIRGYLSELRAISAKMKSQATTKVPAVTAPDGSKLQAKTQSELEAEISKWEEKLSSLGDDAQLANVDMQNWLQKAQQTLQMMSNIAKMMHDTAMAIIRKLK